MYLSRLTLNPQTRRVQKELANPYELHRTLMKAFPETLPVGERVLFRVEINARTGVPTVLLQSHTQPGWGWLDDPGARAYLMAPPETKEFDLTLKLGQVLAFRLRANPTVKQRIEGSEGAFKPVRRSIYREEELRAWLERKGTQSGFCLINLTVTQEGNLLAWQPQSEQGRRKITLAAVSFDGLLQVTDPQKVWEAVQQGIGSGKGMGFGLLSLAQPPA